MTFIDQTSPGQTDTLTFAFDLPHPPEKVWRALTDPELVAKWLLPMVSAANETGTFTKGQAFKLQAPVQPGWDGLVHCQVRDLEPRQKLSYTWVVGALETVVTFSLTSTSTGSHLLLVQTGFNPDQKQAFAGARYGWRMFSERLISSLDN